MAQGEDPQGRKEVHSTKRLVIEVVRVLQPLSRAKTALLQNPVWLVDRAKVCFLKSRDTTDLASSGPSTKQIALSLRTAHSDSSSSDDHNFSTAPLCGVHT